MSVVTEGQRLNSLNSSVYVVKLITGSHAPELDGLIRASRGQSLPIRAKRNASDPSGMTLERALQRKLMKGKGLRRCGGWNYGGSAG
jgi:hypothetical protein